MSIRALHFISEPNCIVYNNDHNLMTCTLYNDSSKEVCVHRRGAEFMYTRYSSLCPINKEAKTVPLAFNGVSLPRLQAYAAQPG